MPLAVESKNEGAIIIRFYTHFLRCRTTTTNVTVMRGKSRSAQIGLHGVEALFPTLCAMMLKELYIPKAKNIYDTGNMSIDTYNEIDL